MATEAAVLDVGSKLVKAGLALPDQDPSIILPTAMARVKEDELSNLLNRAQNSVADITVHPVERGVIEDWDAMEDLWRYVFYDGLGWEIGNEGQLLLADSLLTPKITREKVVQIMFETFNINGFYAVEQPVLSVYAVGRVSGCAVDVGHGKVDIAPVWEGAVQHNAVKRFEFAGKDLTKLFASGLIRQNPYATIDDSLVEMLKETYAVVAEDTTDYANSVSSCPVVDHTLPDGQVIHTGSERYMAGEVLFQPPLAGVEDYGIMEQLSRSVSLCVPSECQKSLIENIVLCGGTSTMKGFEKRFQKEVALLGTPSLRPFVIKPPEYMPENTLKYSAWIGGAILAKVVFPQNQHITKSDYDETGPSIVHRKCY